MRRSSGMRWDVRAWLVVVCALAIVGCRRGLTPASASNPLPPGVPRDVTAYDQLVAKYALSANYHDRQRKWKCFLDLCWTTITVRIQARGDTHAIDPRNAPATAVPVAHMINQHPDRTERYYKLRPKGEAEYDLWVYNDTNSKHAVWTLVERPLTGQSVIAGKPTDFDYCHTGTDYVSRGSDADFAQEKGECTYKPPAASSTVSKASLTTTSLFGSLVAQLSSMLLEFSRNGGGWIDCNNGCCT